MTPRPLATTDEVAEHLRMTRGALAIMRHRGEGPKFVKVGSRVRYDWSDVEAYTAANTTTRTGVAS